MATPTPACPTACPSDPKTGHEAPLEQLAAAILKLSPDDRNKLASLLAAKTDD
jgi:hypothetical protein